MFKSVFPTIGLALSPIYIASLVIAILYRLIGHLLLKFTRADYAGLLDPLEAWFVDENASNLSIVNVFINVKPTSDGKDLRRRLEEKLKRMTSTNGNTRTLCVVDKRFGLKFWRVDKPNIKEQVIPFNASNSKEVKDYLSTVANVPIRNKKLFELHVGLQLVDSKYPLIFRAHHAMGDGYAIRQFLLEDQVTQSSCHNSLSKSVEGNNKKSFSRGLMNNINLSIDVIKMILHTPTQCIEQYLNPSDKNSLKADVLSGEKILSWRTGDIKKIKEIQKLTKSTFTEILLSAMSKSLDDLFKDRGESVSDVTMIYPTRKTQNTNGMGNAFIPVGFKLPVNNLNREMDIREKILELESIPAYKSNYYLPRFAFLLYPMDLPDWVYRSTELTGLLSNVPGPEQKVAFKEFEIEEFAFFLPNLHRDNALGVMMTSYVDKFVCSVIMDRSVARSEEDAQKIVDGMMGYIEDAHKRL